MDDDDSFVPEERNEAGLKLDKRMVRCLSRKALIRRLAVFLEASISFLSFLFFFFFSSSFSSPVLLPVNLIKNLAIARAKKGSGAYHHREKLPSFAPPPSCDIIPPVFYLADTSPFCVPTFLAIFTHNVIEQMQSRPSKNFFFLSSKEIYSFSSFFGKFLRSFRRMDEYNFFAKIFTKDYESWTHIFYLNILWIFRIVVEGEEGRGKLFSLEYRKNGIFIYLFVYLFIYIQLCMFFVKTSHSKLK